MSDSPHESRDQEVSTSLHQHKLFPQTVPLLQSSFPLLVLLGWSVWSCVVCHCRVLVVHLYSSWQRFCLVCMFSSRHGCRLPALWPSCSISRTNVSKVVVFGGENITHSFSAEIFLPLVPSPTDTNLLLLLSVFELLLPHVKSSP